MRLLHRVIYRQLRSCITKSIATDKTRFPFLSSFFFCPLQFALSFDVSSSLHCVSDLLPRGIATTVYCQKEVYVRILWKWFIQKCANILTFCTNLMGDSPYTSQKYIIFFMRLHAIVDLLNQLLDYIFIFV